MKLILTQEVSGLGAPGDVVEVRDGYGRNYLLPRGYAVKWTRGGQRQVDAMRRGRQAREIRNLDEAEQIASQLANLRVTLRRRAGDSGRLFGSVVGGDIAEAVTNSGGPALDKRRIEIQNPIKATGDHRVRVRLHPEVSASIQVQVLAAK
ncbi:50S ribosomal protein L9 [Spiractinospora alimapuensis]|uniref:50S ribosomal protein L9 n=1 Tax=Spiractinospora alimapuensis TaxID=2820884 RepID=UPI001EECEFF8|nr:50S ribosomal protein L9 [Spiractinospora alimapuensis]QVQ50522.1 50S ribosomal protein L9 [Spiractinospora alimapuensis]